MPNDTKRIQIGNLPFEQSPTVNHTFPAMNDGMAVQMAVYHVVDLAIAAIRDGAPEALDTLNELAAALEDDENYAAIVTAALAARLRVDAAQDFTEAQMMQGRDNVGAVGNLVDVIAIPYDADPGALPSAYITKNSAGSFTFNRPAWLKLLRARGVGGGGGGSGVEHPGGSVGAIGKPGAAGGFFDFVAAADLLGASENMTVGDRGSGGSAGANNGTNGGTTSFGLMATAAGGAGGATVSAGANQSLEGAVGGAVGYGIVSRILMPEGSRGQQGGNGLVSDGTPRFSGSGGGTLFGAGGSYTAAGSSNKNGESGTGYGSGGSGGIRYNAGTAYGGDGGIGFIELELYG